MLDLFHQVFSTFLDPSGGAAWALSIIGLTLVIRAALIPLFVKQIKSSRNMQLIQPKVKELQKKYGHDRERLAQETMKLYKETGHQPVRLLPADPAADADLLRAVPHDRPGREGQGQGRPHPGARPSSSARPSCSGCRSPTTFISAGGDIGVMVIAAMLVVAMTATTFLTQRQLMTKNMPADALTGPYAQQQKMLLYVLPLVFAVGGIAFPIGVLLYWTTSNLWTMGQQFYVIRNNPAPGTPAAKAKEERDTAKAAKHGAARPRGGRPPTTERRGGAAARPAAAAQAADPPAAQEVRWRPDPRTRDRHPEGRTPRHDRSGPGRQRRRPRDPSGRAEHARRDDRGTTTPARRPAGDKPSRLASCSSTRATSRPTTSRSCSTSPTSTATSTWTSRATAPRSRSSAPTCSSWSGRNGEVLEALQELTRLAVYRETGERSRLMLDIAGHRAEQRAVLEAARGADGR